MVDGPFLLTSSLMALTDRLKENLEVGLTDQC